MTLTQTEAAEALRDIDVARTQSRTLFIYRSASPYLLLWGVLWVIGGLMADFAPHQAGAAWLTIDVIGVTTSIYIGFMAQRRVHGVAATGEATARTWAWRYAATQAVCFAFAAITLVIFAPWTGAQVMTFSAVFTAAIFAALGIWIGLRYVAVAAGLAGIALALHFLRLPHEVTLICLAGGTAMIIGGVWMRQS